MLRISVKSIHYSRHRYPTVGDWWYDPADADHMEVRVSEMGDWRYELLVAVHEIVEQAICRHKGISEQAVTQFDLDYEKARPIGDVSEPGDSKDAPYHEAHKFAMFVERALAFVLDVDWGLYEKFVEEL